MVDSNSENHEVFIHELLSFEEANSFRHNQALQLQTSDQRFDDLQEEEQCNQLQVTTEICISTRTYIVRHNHVVQLFHKVEISLFVDRNTNTSNQS